MSFPHLNATLPAPSLPACTGEQFSQELALLVADIQRTKDWFNAQMDAQLVGLHQLRASMQVDDPACSTPMATLFEAPRPVVVEAMAPEPTLPKVRNDRPLQPVVLPATLAMALDPQLEQATLHELNNALSLAFSEISSRGGMLG
jgi:hypothetical protein